jgi:hypothetical protein
MHALRANRVLWGVGLLLAVLTVVMINFGSGAGSASAESGRRLCVYTQNQGGFTQAADNRPYHAYVAVKSGKDGDCPIVNPEKWRWQVGDQPVKKIPCEDWPAEANPWPGEDVCTHLPDDAVFEARRYDDNKGVGDAIYANVSQFQ